MQELFLWVAIPAGAVIALILVPKIVRGIRRSWPGGPLWGRLLQASGTVVLLALIAYAGWRLWGYWETGGMPTSTTALPVLNWAIPLIIIGIALWGAGVALGPGGKVLAGAGGLCFLLAIGGGIYACYLGEPLSRWGGSSATATPGYVPLPGDATMVVPAYGRSPTIRVPIGKKLDPVLMPGGVTFHVVFADGRMCVAWQTCEKDGPHHYKNGDILYVYLENEEGRAATVRYRFIPLS